MPARVCCSSRCVLWRKSECKDSDPTPHSLFETVVFCFDRCCYYILRMRSYKSLLSFASYIAVPAGGLGLLLGRNDLRSPQDS